MDYGHNETDRAIQKLAKRLEKEYKTAYKEVEGKLDDYMRRFAVKDKTWQKWVNEGKKTSAQYKAWRKQQILVGKRWNKLKNELADSMWKADAEASNIIRYGQADVYALNINYATFSIEKKLGVDTGFTQYNRDAVHRILVQNPKILPPPSKNGKLSQRIREGKAKRWHKQKLQSVATQAILQGESIPNVAKRIMDTLGETDAKAAIRNARTMMTGAENAGKFDAFNRARDMGIECIDYWLAVHDARTRTSHRELDGEQRGEDGYFSNGLAFPGDPDGDAAEVYNCRCSLMANIKGFKTGTMSPEIELDPEVADMTYEEWKKARPRSQDIMHQKELNDRMRGYYVNEYRRG